MKKILYSEYNNFPSSVMTIIQKFGGMQIIYTYTWIHFFEKRFLLFVNCAQMSCKIGKCGLMSCSLALICGLLIYYTYYPSLKVILKSNKIHLLIIIPVLYYNNIQ